MGYSHALRSGHDLTEVRHSCSLGHEHDQTLRILSWMAAIVNLLCPTQSLKLLHVAIELTAMLTIEFLKALSLFS